MDSRSAYRLQLMEKLGSKLAAALPFGMDGEKAAETMASLIGRAVQLGLMLAQKMKLSDEDNDADSVRLSLAALAAPLLAQHYEHSGKIPDDAALEKLAKGLEATLVFSENFTAAQEHTARLKSLHDPLPLFDMTQVHILMLNAIVPALGAVQNFSFGQGEGALIKDIAQRLDKTATRLADEMVKGDPADKEYARLTLLRALAEIYANVHINHTKDAESKAGDEAPTLDAVWKDFDTQIGMIEVLTGMAVPDPQSAATSGGGQAPAQAQAQAQQPAPPPQQEPQQGAPSNPMGFFKKQPSGERAPATPPPQQEPSQQPPAQPPAENKEQPAQGGNPMSFFKKPQGGQETSE